MRTGYRITPDRVGAILRDLLGATAFITLMFVCLAPLLLLP